MPYTSPARRPAGCSGRSAAWRRFSQTVPENANQSFGGEASHDQGHQSERQHMVLAVSPNVFRQNFKAEGTDDGPREGSQSADDRHGKHQKLLVEGWDMGGDQQQVVPVKGAGHARQSAGYGEGQQPHPHHIHTEGRRGALVIEHRPEIQTGIGMDQPVDDTEGQQCGRQEYIEIAWSWSRCSTDRGPAAPWCRG